MNSIYVVGHRNPDTDSIVSAMAYAALQNALGSGEYKAARLGHVSDETKLVLNRFGFQPPELLSDVRTQVKDLDFDTPPVMNKGVTLERAWSALHLDCHIQALPIVDNDGKLYGMVSPGDIAGYNMQACDGPHLDEVPLFNILGTLEGKVRNKSGAPIDTVKGDVVLSLPVSRGNLLFNQKESVVICGDQPDMIRRALDIGVNCLIVCQAQIDPAVCEENTKTCIISTPFPAVKAIRKIYQAIPVSRLCGGQELVYFHLDDHIDDVKNILQKSRYRSYPILDSENKVVGTLSRYHLFHHRKKQVVLVDHNEMAQSVPGLEQAEILGIIDHHRLADIQTASPVYMRNEPVGSTTTIVAGMYQTLGIMPSEQMAGLMAAAIISDTVIFKSPTCTERDRVIAERLARMADISLEELGHEMFSASYGWEKPVDELVMSDFKEFHIAGHNIAVSQITCVDTGVMLERREEFADYLGKMQKEHKYDFVILMLTDVLKDGSNLLYIGDDDAIRQAFGAAGKNNSLFLPGVMSRKKQLIPMLSALWG